MRFVHAPAADRRPKNARPIVVNQHRKTLGTDPPNRVPHGSATLGIIGFCYVLIAGHRRTRAFARDDNE